ncbi:MAG: CopD family protein [Rubrivivax sp.]
MRPLLLFVHLAGAIVWIGGMVFAQFCLRPAAAQMLAPPQRLPLMAAALERFLRLVTLAVLALLASGGALLGAPQGAPAAWLAMAALGVVMALVFVLVRWVQFPRLQRHVAAAEWPQAAQAMDAVRRLVAVNLVLSVATVAAAVAAR